MVLSGSFEDVGTDLAEHMAVAVEQFGGEITWEGQVYLALVDDVPRRELADLAEGLGINAATADPRVLHLASRHFPTGFPGEEATVTWDEGWGSRTYKVIRAVAVRVAGVTLGCDLTVTRQAAPDAATEEGPTEAAPGRRVPYRPKSVTS
ncbi:MAG: hypothetical protein JO250_12440 [Armatimonadetes bacterium]|nr:hypothetical protein [Armatimonadota bacterium]